MLFIEPLEGRRFLSAAVLQNPTLAPFQLASSNTVLRAAKAKRVGPSSIALGDYRGSTKLLGRGARFMPPQDCTLRIRQIEGGFIEGNFMDTLYTANFGHMIPLTGQLMKGNKFTLHGGESLTVGGDSGLRIDITAKAKGTKITGKVTVSPASGSFQVPKGKFTVWL
ncbi:hypothetical protein KW782_00490 [Candidatus Parcubacteria bacterium]|nr:hypothetical protein [Candidatus Parcubacteria bacterium]